jgi:hypothetical protein
MLRVLRQLVPIWRLDAQQIVNEKIFEQTPPERSARAHMLALLNKLRRHHTKSSVFSLEFD